MSKRGRGWFAVVAVTVVALSVVGAARLLASGDDQAQVLRGSAPSPGWLRLEYRNVQVSIPDDWDRQPSGDCVQAVEHWGPQTTADCGSRSGVTFLDDSETFDASGEPKEVYPNLAAEGPSWLGYVLLDDLVVSVSDNDRTIVQQVIESISMDGYQSSP